jgi:hypothetical protein
MDEDDLISDLQDLIDEWCGDPDYRESPKRQIIKNNCARDIEEVLDQHR